MLFLGCTLKDLSINFDVSDVYFGAKYLDINFALNQRAKVFFLPPPQSPPQKKTKTFPYASDSAKYVRNFLLFLLLGFEIFTRFAHPSTPPPFPPQSFVPHAVPFQKLFNKMKTIKL